MADPLSIASGIAGLAMLAKDVTKKIMAVMEAVRESQTEIRKLCKEVLSLYGVLSKVRIVLDQLDDDEMDEAPSGAIIMEINQALDQILQLLQQCFAKNEISNSDATNQPNNRRKGRKLIAIKQGVRWHFKKETIEKLCADVERHKTMLSLEMEKESLSAVVDVLKKQEETIRHVQELRSHIRSTEIEAARRRMKKEQRKVVNEFSKIEPETFRKRHIEARQNGTGIWFLEGIDFRRFLSTKNSRLWLHGIPGAGKSVLSASIIDTINDRLDTSHATAFFFCDYGNEQTQVLNNILGSIAKQLALQSDQALVKMVDFYKYHDELDTFDLPNLGEEQLLELIWNMSSHFISTVIVIDGLDECLSNRPRTIKSLAKLSRTDNSVKTLFASRDEEDIRNCLKEFQRVSVAASKADVRLYVAAQLESRFETMPDELKEEIQTDLVDRSDGMFQWVRCQLDHFDDLPTHEECRKALKDLPPTLPETYERILVRAAHSASVPTLKCIERTIRWVALAKEPLCVRQLSEAVSIDEGQKVLDQSNRVDMEKVLRHCSSLIRKFEDRLSFSHFSVKEYLRQIRPEQKTTSRFRIDDKKDQEYLGATCLRYLLLDSNIRLLEMGFDRKEFEEHLKSEHPFLKYAAKQWIFHSRQLLGSSGLIAHLVTELFSIKKSDNFVLLTLVWLFYSQMLKFNNVDDALKRISNIGPIHMSCLLHLPNVIEGLIANDAEVNHSSEELSTPLMCAINGPNRWDSVATEAEKLQTVRNILSGDIIDDTKVHDPLKRAIVKKDARLILMLLKAGFSLRADLLLDIVRSGQTFHQIIAEIVEEEHSEDSRGNIQLLANICKALENREMGCEYLPLMGDLSHGAPMSSHFQNQHKGLIIAAASQGQLSKIKYLLSQLPDMTGTSRIDLLSECLGDAAEQGHTGMVAYLVNENADLTHQHGYDQRTALHRAAATGRHEIVRWILNASNNAPRILESEDEGGMTPWMCAVEKGHMYVFQMFLQVRHRLDLSKTTKLGYNIIHLVIQSQNWHLFELIKGLGVGFKCKATNGNTPFHLLLKSCSNQPFMVHEDFLERRRHVLKYLAQQNRDVSDVGDSGDTILHHLARMDAKDAGTVLNAISAKTNEPLGFHVAIRHQNTLKKTPLHVLMESYSRRIHSNPQNLPWTTNLRRFMTWESQRTDFLDIRDLDGRTPMISLAANLGYNSARSNGFIYPVPRISASKQNISEIFKILLGGNSNGHFLDAQDKEGNTVLHYAACWKSQLPAEEILNLILQFPADMTKANEFGRTPLATACWSAKNITSIRILAAHTKDAGWEQQDSEGSTPLHYLLKLDEKNFDIQDLVKKHLHRIATCEVKDGEGHAPLAYVPNWVSEMSVALELVSMAGDNVMARGDDGRDVMSMACQCGANAMVAALIDYGIDLNEPRRAEGTNVPNSMAEDPPLMVAARAGKIDTVNLLIENGADVCAKGKDDWQILHLALSNNPNSCRLRKILERRGDIDYKAVVSNLSFRMRTGRFHLAKASPIHVSVVNRDIEALTWLLENRRGVEVDAQTGLGLTALCLACRLGYMQHCKTLIDRGASITRASTEIKPRHPFYGACVEGHTTICRYLTSMNKTVISTKIEGHTPMEIAAEYGHTNLIRFFLSQNCEISLVAQIKASQNNHEHLADFLEQEAARRRYSHEPKGPEEATLNQLRLESACSGYKEQVLIDLIQEGIDPNIRINNRQTTLLHQACLKGWVRAVANLVGRGANKEALGYPFEETPLFTALGTSNFACARSLLKYGADLRARNWIGCTVLHEATVLQNPQELEFLITAGANVNAQSFNGSTPLRLAHERSSIQLLLDKGADPFVESFKGSPFWYWASEPQFSEFILRVVTEYPREQISKATATRAAEWDWTPLALSAFRGMLDRVRLLVQHGADINLIGSRRYGTPIWAARKLGHYNVVEFLFNQGAKPCIMALPSGQERAAWPWEFGLIHSLPSAASNGAWLPVLLEGWGDQMAGEREQVKNDGVPLSGNAGAGLRIYGQALNGA